MCPMRVGISGMFWNMETTGSGQYVGHLLSALIRQQGEDAFDLLVPPGRPQPGRDGPLHGRTRALSTPFDRMQDNLAKVWFEQVSFPRACHGLGVDVAHVPYFAPPLHSPVPTLVTIHDLIPLVLPEYRGSLWVRGYMRLVATAARRAVLIATDSRASARDISTILRIPAERIRVIYLAASPIYRPLTLAERQPVLERLGIGGPYLLYLGGFDRRKNVAGLLRALDRARQALRGVHLVVAGRVPEHIDALHPDPRKLVVELDLKSMVQLVGWVAEEDKPALYGGALGLVFPSWYEGFGLPVLEAISCGTPVIVGAGSSLEEVAGPGGLAISPGDLDALAEAMMRLVEDDGWRRNLARQGLRHAAGFSWEETARQTWQAYRDTCSGARPR